MADPFPKWNYVAFALVAFALHLALDTKLYNMHVFQQYDVLFNADPNEGIVNLSHGWGKSEFKHLTLTYLFSPLARIFASVVQMLSLSSVPEPVVRERFTLFFLALLSAVRASLFLEVARFLKLSHKAALGLNTLALLAFSNLLFGAIPDSFALSGTCLVIAYYLALKPPPLRNPQPAPASRSFSWETVSWGLLFLVATGVTITNAFFVGLLFLLCLIRRSKDSFWRKILTVGVTATAAVLINVAVAEGAKFVLHSQTAQLSYSPAGDKYVHQPSWTVALAIGRAFGNGLSAGVPTITTLSLSPDKTVWYTSALTYETPEVIKPPDVVRIVLVTLALILGVAGYIRSGTDLPVLWITIGIVLTSVVIHMFFGDEYVLYSLHWHYSLMVLLAGIPTLISVRMKQVATILAAGVIILVSSVNAIRVCGIVTSLQSMQLPAPLHTPDMQSRRPSRTTRVALTTTLEPSDSHFVTKAP